LEGWENIRIVSIVDRFLEHTRVYRFRNNGNPEYYLSSADMMPRNLDRRIETFFPVDSRSIQEELDQLLKLQLNDTYKGRTLQRDGRYTTAGRGSVKKRSQALTYNYFKRKLTQAENPTSKRSLHVLQSPDGES
jgi:polyphosphate kinase